MKDTINCGDPTHSEECLCDVVVSSPTPINITNAITDYRFGAAIATYREFKRPMTDENIVQFFTDLVAIRDTMNDPDSLAVVADAILPQVATGRPRTLLNDEQDREVRIMFVMGASAADVRKHLMNKYGIKMSNTHSIHLRQRTLESVGIS